MKDFTDFMFKAIAVYCLILVVVGTLSNLLASYICMRRKLRSVTTFVFICLMVISDTFALYVWCFDHFLEIFFDFTVEKHSIWSCRIALFIQYVSLEWSSWLLVALSVDRWWSVEFKTWRTFYFKPTQAFLLSIVILSIIAVLNSNLLVLSGNYDQVNNVLYCYTEGQYSDWILFWQKIHAFLYSLLPLIMVTTSNSMLLYRANKKPSTIVPQSNNLSIRKRFADRKKMISLSILVVTLGFVLSTTPCAIIMGFFIQDLYRTRTGKLIVWIFDALLFTYHSVKFEIILIFNYQFKQEFSTFLTELSRKRKNLLTRKKTTHLTTHVTKSISDISV